jgi:tripartite-type tricarboxylate transporter receptor subunit TctC
MLVLSAVLVLGITACSSGTQGDTSGTSESASDASASKDSDYPNKSLNLIVPFGAGGTTDTIGRLFANTASKYLGETIIIENKTGASGVVGHTYMKSVAPDGYTLIVTGNSPSVVVPNLESVEYDPIDDFEFIGLLSNARNAIAVAGSSPFNTLTELIEYSLEHPGEVTVATSGANGMDDFTIRLINQVAGTDMITIAFDSNGEGIAAVMGGHTTAYCNSALSLKATIESGEMKMIGIVSDERHPDYPDVKTAREMGIDVSINNLTGIATNADVSAEELKILRDTIQKVCEDPAFIDAMQNAGLTVDYEDGEGFKEFIISESDKIKTIIENEQI